MDQITDPRWFLVAGGTLVLMALASSVLRRLPLTASLLYLGVGAAVGPAWLGLVQLSPTEDEGLLELLTELAVIVSLFTAGLKLRDPLVSGRWRLPVRLAVVSMTVTVLLIALTGVAWLGLPLGAAVLLGGILAPTDPVLASDVQVVGPTDSEDLRFGLTGEAALNDGSAFPFVMLGLGLLGLHELGDGGLRWIAVDVVYGVLGGLAIGGGCGFLIGRLVLYLRRTHREALGLDEFLGLGLIALSYGAALAAGTYGFLSVFAAGLAVRWIELQATGREPVDPQAVESAHRGGEDPMDVATDPERAPAYLASVLLEFNEKLERLGEIALVVLIGAMLATVELSWQAIGFAVLLFAVIRPLSVIVGLAGSGLPRLQVGFVAWFGIRGIGSLFYLTFALAHADLPTPIGAELASFVLTTVALSIVVHGVSVTPLMDRYEGWRRRASRRAAAEGSPATPD